MKVNRLHARATAFAAGLLALFASTANAQRAAETDAQPFTDTLPFAAPAPPAPEDVIMLQLRDGSIHWGAIDAHDPAFLEFVRLDTSGRVQVPWGLLSPGQADALRTKYGYVEVEAEEAFLQGDRLTLKGGGIIEGVITNREGANFEIKTDGNLQSIPKARVAGVESKVLIPALDVYSRQELYTTYLSEADPMSADSQLALARKCESILDFVHAAEHYEAALELGLEQNESKATGALARAQVKAANQEQVEYLRETNRLRKRRQFDKAQAMLTAFDATFKDSPLLEDARKQEARLLLARDAAAKTYVQRRWKYWAGRLARRESQQPTFEAARTWAVERASDEILELVVVDVIDKITKVATPEMVRALWDERDRGRYIATTYGSDGTWLLGADAARAGGDDSESARKGPVSEVDAQRQALEDRIKRYLDNQRIASRSRGATDAEDMHQVFWSSWPQNSRASWLFAYYVEQAGDFDLRPKPYLKACRTCGGSGAIELLVTGNVLRGESQSLANCPLCHGVQVVRRIYYR